MRLTGLLHLPSALNITDALKNFFDGRKVLVGRALPHALAVELEYGVPDGCHGPIFISVTRLAFMPAIQTKNIPPTPFIDASILRDDRLYQRNINLR
ncbi:MAG: hypothetical protein P8X80_13535 [Desulfobacterales bacterium]